MNIIGLTGGIGSGKSTVATIFNTLGIPVYNSDLRAKHLMNTKDDIRKKIIHHFGHEAYDENKELNAPWIASKVFNDRDQLFHLNSIVHPAVYEDLLEWSVQPDQLAAPYFIQESAILFEEELSERLKAIILVVAPEEIRIARVIERDHLSRDQIMERIKNQWSDEKKIPLSDYVIYNDGERSLIEQVTDIDRMIRS
ncbi:MAG TPA: dephospho-CoA kinase [Saprospiraceae bacterium]|nr:dephospho-CoA kinase [Saprospiraceae bacterium]